jgi:hypothetical protein
VKQVLIQLITIALFGALPLDRRELQATPIHFLAKPLGLLLGRIAHEAVRAAGLRVLGDLVADAVVKPANTVIRQALKFAH